MTKELTIIQQNDTHGCLEMHEELFWETGGPSLRKAGGFSRISNYVKAVRRQKSNVLFFDGGDLFHGTLPLVSSKGEVIIPILEKIGLDAIVPGNWDFAYGREQLRKLADRLPFPFIACNVTEFETELPLFSPYIIKELQGVKVGVIGLTYPYVDKTMPESFSEGLAFSKGIEEVRRIVEDIEHDVDLIILISHMGLPLDVKLSNLISGIDLILSGHSHDRVTEPIVANGTLIVQAGSSSSFLGRLDLTLDSGKIIEAKYQLVDVQENLEEDGEIKSLIQEVMKSFEAEREMMLGHTKTLLHRMTLNESPMDRLITDAYLNAYDCDLSLSHGWRYGTPIAPGPISKMDLYNIIPTNPKMFTLEIDGQSLLNALENNLEQVFSSDPFEQKGGYILRSSGLFMTFKPYNPKGNRIQNLRVGAEEINFHKIYKIAGGGQQLFKEHEHLKHYKNTNAIDVIQTFLQDKGSFETTVGDKIISV